MVLVSWFILLQLKFVQVDKCVISASASAWGGSMEMYLLLAQKSMHDTFGTMENYGNLPKKNRLMILPTYKRYKPLIFRNTFRCTDDQSSIKVNEGHKQCCVPMVPCLVKHEIWKRWLQVARDLNLYNLLQDRGVGRIGQTDRFLVVYDLVS